MRKYRLQTRIKCETSDDAPTVEATLLGRWSGLLGKGWHSHFILEWKMHSIRIVDADRMARALRHFVRIHDRFPDLRRFERKLLGLA